MNVQDMAAIEAGGASGLGGGAPRLFAARGAKVVIIDLNREVGEATAAEIGGHFVAVDVTDDATIATGLAEAEADYGVAQVLVCCAGIAPVGGS